MDAVFGGLVVKPKKTIEKEQYSNACSRRGAEFCALVNQLAYHPFVSADGVMSDLRLFVFYSSSGNLVFLIHFD